MQTRIDEIAPDIYRISTFVPEVAPPAGFSFNQFLIAADRPLLFHCGHRGMFPAIAEAVARVLPVERLRWLAFSHLEADECGAMNQWLAAAPEARIAHGATACMVSLEDLADRAPHTLADGDALDLGGKRVRFLETPHVPHGWDAGLLYEETTGTLFCSDLLAQVGDGPAVTDGDVVGPAVAAEEMFQAMPLTPRTAPTLRRLAALEPKTLAIMHGASLAGDGAAALREFAGSFEARLRAEARGDAAAE